MAHAAGAEELSQAIPYEDAWTRHKFEFPRFEEQDKGVRICEKMEDLSRAVLPLVKSPSHCPATRKFEERIRRVDSLWTKNCRDLEIAANKLLDGIPACVEARPANQTEVEHMEFLKKWIRSYRAFSMSAELDDEYEKVEKEAVDAECAWNSALLFQFRKRQLYNLSQAFGILEAGAYACLTNEADKVEEIRALREQLY